MRSGVVNETDAMIGVLLPPSVAAVIANTGLGLSGKAVANLNYTFISEGVGSSHALASNSRRQARNRWTTRARCANTDH
jgi:hypothetical protein